MLKHASTGIPGLDRRLDGGVHTGSLLAIVAPPDSQSERLLHVLMGQRPTLYLSTLRPETAIDAHLENSRVTIDDVTVEYVGSQASMGNDLVAEMTGERSYSMSLNDNQAPFDDVYEAIDGVGDSMNVILDPMTPLEDSGQEAVFQTVLNKLKAEVLASDSLGILHCIDHDSAVNLREMTLNMADTVWKLDVELNAEEVQYRLTIPKNRSGSIIDEQISLLFGRTLTIDDSRTI